jgi:hypothetical protein
MRALGRPLLLRALLPTMGVWWLSILVGLAITRVFWPDIDTNGWPFIVVFFPISCLVCAIAAVVFHVLLVRWLIRYRTSRRGRVVAMRDVLRPSDIQPSKWRLFWLNLYGVTPGDLGLIPSLWPPTNLPTAD